MEREDTREATEKPKNENRFDEEMGDFLPPSQREQDGSKETEITQLKEELVEVERQTSELVDTLNKAMAKIADQEKLISDQEELLIKVDFDHETGKAAAKAEKDTLTTLLNQETKRRRELEAELRRVLVSKKLNFPEGERMPAGSASSTAASFNGAGDTRSTGDGEAVVADDKTSRQENEDDGRVLVIDLTGEEMDDFDASSVSTDSNRRRQIGQPKKDLCIATRGTRARLQQSRVDATTSPPTFSRNNRLVYGPSVPIQAEHRVNDGLSDNKFPCHVCDRRFEIVSRLKRHLEQAHGIINDKFCIGCKDCGLVFASREDHIHHRKDFHGTLYNTQHGRKRYRQELARALQRATFRRPRSSITAGSFPSQPGNDKTRAVDHGVDTGKVHLGYYCYCGQNFATMKDLNKHFRYILDTQGFNCHICGYSFVHRRFLKMHMNLAHGRKTSDSVSSTCSEASFKTSTGSGAAVQMQEKHELMGKDPKRLKARYPCSCGREYQHRFSFMSHVRVKLTGKIFQCTLCRRRFYQHGNLKCHVVSAHKVPYEKGKFACGNCALTFQTYRLLCRHRFFHCSKRVARRSSNRKVIN